MTWPDHFPEDCPPEDTSQGSFRVYYLANSPIQPKNFESLKERNPRFSGTSEQECQACGLSIYEEIDDIRRTRRRVKRLRNRVIAVGTITTPQMGVIKPTSSRHGNSHRTWWVPIEIEPWKLFRIWET